MSSSPDPPHETRATLFPLSCGANISGHRGEDEVPTAVIKNRACKQGTPRDPQRDILVKPAQPARKQLGANKKQACKNY